MLSLGPLQFKGHETIADAVENYTGEMAAAGRSFADPTFALVDYSELMNSKRSPCWIPDTAYRGMTLQQLHEVLGFMGHQAFAWHEARRHSPSYGCRIPEEKFNLYHASYWIINPATQGYGLVGCSLVELIAEDAELQKPRWFVSHAWLEPITLFVANLSRHAHVRQLELDTAFWVCAYANNQHHLEADVGENPRRSSFYRAMQRCEGVVLLLDDQATPFRRIWCCFEEAIAVEKRNGTERRHKLLLDVCATDADGVAHVITDGLAGIENQMVPLLGLHHKTCREMTFPMHILQKGLRINILSATASHEADRTRILNSIAFPHARLEELSATPPQEHEKYQTVNCALSAQFALASWCNSILQGWDPTPLAKALVLDTSRRMVQLSFTGCIRLYDSDLAMLVNHLPLSLEVLRLDLGFTSLVTLEPLERLGQCNSLVHLELRFPGCKHLESMAGLGVALQEMSQLRLLALWFSKLMNLESIEGLDEALPKLTSLECLAMNLDRCPKVPLAARKALYRGVKSLKRRQGILESWVHIQDVDQDNLIMRCVKRCTCGTKPQKPSPWHSEKNPVLLGRAFSVRVGDDEKSPISLRHSRARHFEEEITVPFPCSQPGCREFHDDCSGYCLVHRHFRIPWSIGASIWVFLQQLWLAFMFMILAVLELESKALSTVILLSLSPILCQALATQIGGSAVVWMCVLVPVLWIGVGGTSARFNSMYRISTQHELTLEALCSQMLQFTCVVADSAAPSTGPASAAVAAQQALNISTVFGCEDPGSFDELQQEEAAKDLRCNYLLARRRVRAFQREVCEPINAALGRDSSFSAVRPELKTLFSAKDALAQHNNSRKLIDLLYCDVICEDFQEVRAVLQALKGRAQAQSDVGVPGGLQVHHVRDGFSRDFQDAEGRCGKIVVELDGYLATVRVYEASLHELREQMGRVHRLVHGFGFFQACVDFMDSDTPLRPLVEMRPPAWFQLLRACTGLMRLLALTTAAYFAMQYFVRYGPQAAKERLPRSLDSLLAWSDQHNQDVKALHQALGNTDDALAASLVPWTREGDGFSWLGGFVYAFPYVVHVVIFMQDLIRRPSFRTLTNAPMKRLKPMHTIYEKYFGVQGSLYTAKVALLQLLALPLQCFGKIGLLGSICTAGKFADEVRWQHEANRGGDGSQRAVSDLLVTGYWIFVFFLGLNCIYPALLISFGEHRWASFLTAWSDAIVHLSYILIYLTMSLISLHKLHFKDTVIYVGNMTIQLSNELNPIFPFPTTLLGYVSIYISLVHVCCVCRVLEDTAAQFALKSAEERGFERSMSSTSLLTSRRLVSIASLFQGVRKRTRFLLSLLYFMVMVGIVMLAVANQHGYPKQAMDTRCYPCLCSNGQMPGTLRLESCWLASTLRFKYLNLANRGISELEPRAMHPLGEDLLILSLASNNLQNLPPGFFGGLREARLLDLSHCMLQDLNRGHFEGLVQVGSLSLSGNHIRQLPPDVFEPMPQLKQILLGGERRNVGDEELLVLGNLLSELPAGIFKDLQWLVRVDISQNRLSSVPRGVFESLPRLAQIELRDNLLQEIDSEIFIDLPSLANLSLENNVLRRIEPGAFSQVPSLRRLDLARNQLEGMLSVAAATGLGNLEQLNLSRNHLQGIESGALALLRSLRVLDLSGNELRNSSWAAVGLHYLTSLEVLCLAEVYLPTLPPLPSSLRRLELQGSRLRNLSGSAFQGLKQLETLQLQQNFLGPSLPLTVFRDLEALRTLKLGRNQLKDLEPTHFQGCENLETLDLSENFLSNLSAGTFPSSLELLNLSFNVLGDLPPLAFAANLRLRWLHLRSAGLQKLQQDCFLNLTALQGLDLASNALDDDASFEDLEQLRFLDLSQNLLKQLRTETFMGMEALEWLDLAQNRLEGMTGGFSFGAQLEVLNLSSNQLGELWPGTFQNASHLLNLDLSFNPLGWLPAGVFQGLESSLQTLDLSHTKLTRHTTMPELPALILLNLSGNGLEQLQPMDFHGLSSLEILDLSHNALGNGSIVEPLKECGNLRFLSLAGNYFKEAPNLEGPLERLELQQNGLRNVSGLEGAEIQELLLQDNQLTGDVEKLIFGSFLRAVNLARNRLQSLSWSSAASESNLEVLDLSENDLVELEDAFFSSFGHLKVLNLSQNKLQRLSFPPGSLPELQILEVAGNRLERLPCGAGSPQVLDAKWNRLKDVSEALPCLSKTRKLDLSYNQLSSVSLAPLSRLLALHLAMNQLPWLPQKLPSSLQLLDLSDNPLRRPSRDHPHHLPPLPSLLNLRLRNVSLSALTAWTFQRMPRLRALDVSQNRLLYLPQGIFQGISHLRSVRLANCSLQLINAKTLTLPRLEELDLTGNQLQAIAPSCLAPLPSLRSLQLADNRLEVLQSYALPSLRLLSVPRNRLRVLKANSFIHMQTLQVLNLAENYLEELPADVFLPLVQLEVLNLLLNPLMPSLIRASLPTGRTALKCSCAPGLSEGCWCAREAFYHETRVPIWI